MERSKLLTIAVIGLLLLNVATLGFLLLKRPPPPSHDRGGPARIIIEKLHLDEEQQKKFRELAKAHHAAFEKLQETSRENHHQYYELLKSDAIDMAKADSLNTLIASTQKEIDKLNFNHFMDIKALCNPEQKVLFANFADEISRFFNGPPPRDND